MPKIDEDPKPCALRPHAVRAERAHAAADRVGRGTGAGQLARVKDQTNKIWDTHRQHAASLKSFLMPMMDQAYWALLEDLSQRGLLDDTLVLWLAEFRHTPKITAAGRDH